MMKNLSIVLSGVAVILAIWIAAAFVIKLIYP